MTITTRLPDTGSPDDADALAVPIDGAVSPKVVPPLAHGVIAFAFLLVAEFFYSWSWNSVDVLRPYMRATLGLTLTQAGSGYSAQGAGALIGAVVMGQLADRFGRRVMLAMVMVGYGLCLASGSAVASYAEFLLQRFILGLFLGGIFPIVVGIYTGLFAGNVGGLLAGLINAVFSAAISVLGWASGALDGDWRTLLLIGGVPPVLLAGFAFVAVPRSASVARPGGTARRRAPVLELFAPGVRGQTLMLVTLTGLNFFGYQAFSGWQTSYLRDVRHLSPTETGAVVAVSFLANIIGGFTWGVASDRFGRRFNALGFLIAAAAVPVYLTLAHSVGDLRAVGAVYGFSLSASVVWGPWLTELYPPHLKSTAASIFNWGRVVSFFAPLVTGALAERMGLGVTMGAASVAFGSAGLVWLALPETHPDPLLPGGRRRISR